MPNLDLNADRLLANHGVRLLVAAITIALLVAMRPVVHWIESAYPLQGGFVIQALQYTLFGIVLAGSAAVSLMAWVFPAWVLAGLLRRADRVEARAILAVVGAFVIQPLMLAAMLAIAGHDQEPESFRRSILVLQGILLLGSALVRVPNAATPRWSRDRLLLFGAFTLLVTLVLLPYLAWIDYNPDGVEILTLGRSLEASVVPRMVGGRLPPTDLVMFTASYPINWLVAVDGLGEVAGRLPAVGYAVAIAVGVIALAEQRTPRLLTTSQVGLVLAAVAAIVFTLGFNTAYHPYSTDVSSPASIDLLALVFLLATLYFIEDGSATWTAASAALMALTRPTAVMVFALLAGATFVVERTWRSERLRLALVAFGVAFLVSVMHGIASGDGDGALSRVRYLRFDDWSRIRFLLIPSGVLPVLAWLNWKKFDAWARAMILTTAGYFLFFYCMAAYALHHFAPAMLLPLVVFWRHENQRESASPVWRAATLVGVGLAFVASLPRNFSVYRGAREIAATTSYEVGDYRSRYADVKKAFLGTRAADLLFEVPTTPNPFAARIASSYSLLHYAALSGHRSDAQYVVRDSTLAAPPGMTAQGTRLGATVYVRDLERWKLDRSTVPPPAPRSRVYDVPRASIFRHLALESGLVQLDLLVAAQKVRSLVSGPGR